MHVSENIDMGTYNNKDLSKVSYAGVAEATFKSGHISTAIKDIS